MSGIVYALLVGINEYHSSIGRLDGSLNDIEAFHHYLKNRFGNERLAVETLTNAEATYSNVVNAFRNHLARAQSDDVALFHFCGHGARWRAASEFTPFYPDRWDEGLVCIDSRVNETVYDLADKELAVLLNELARNSPHIAVILDCCYSGSATRALGDLNIGRVRQTHSVPVVRPLETYIDRYYARLVEQTKPLTIPRSRHIVLSACDRNQKAFETLDGIGVFTAALIDVLNNSSGDVTYADLFVRCRAAVRRRVREQEPQFDSYEGFNAYAAFLTSVATSNERRYLVHFDGGRKKWLIQCGAVHGMPTEPEKRVVCELVDGTTTEPVGTGLIAAVSMQESVLTLDFAGRPERAYWAHFADLPVAPLFVGLGGDDEGRDILRRQWNRSFGIAWVDEAERPKYFLRAEVNDASRCFVLRNASGEVQLRVPEDAAAFTPEAAVYVLGALRQVAQWERLLRIQNRSTRLDSATVDFWISIEPNSQRLYPDEDGNVNIMFERRSDDKAWAEIPFTLHARNTGDQQLHLALFFFSRRFGILGLHNDPLSAGDEVILDDSHALTLDHTNAEDEFLLFLSTERLDAALLEQDDVPPEPEALQRGRSSVGAKRKIRTKDWCTKLLRIRKSGKTSTVDHKTSYSESAE